MVEEDEKEYDKDSASDYPTAFSDEANFMFLRAVTTRSGLKWSESFVGNDKGL